jgi:hypothetical protein
MYPAYRVCATLVVHVSVDGSLPVVTYQAEELLVTPVPAPQFDTMPCQLLGCVMVCDALAESSKYEVQTSPAGIPTGIFRVMLVVELEL